MAKPTSRLPEETRCKFPPTIRRDLRTVRDIVHSDIPCNPLWLLAAANILRDIAREIETQVSATGLTVIGGHHLNATERATCEKQGF